MPTPMNVPKPAHIPGCSIEAAAPVRAAARPGLLPRALVANAAAVLGLVALLPAGASAAAPSTGLLANVTTALSGVVIHPGDLIASGWAISMPGPHAAASVSLTGITASVPVTCRTWGSTSASTVVLHLPDASRSLAANDPAWYPTAATAAVQGYQLAQAVTAACPSGLLTPNGAVSYAAKLVSSDTADLFAMRFHTVDPNALRLPWAAQPPAAEFGGSDPRGSWSPDSHDARSPAPPHMSSAFGSPGTNTNCASASQNSAGVSQCNAPWTPTTTARAAAPAGTSGSGSGSTSGTGSGSGKGSGSGTGSGVSAGPVAGTGSGSGSSSHVGAPPTTVPAGPSLTGTVHPRAGTGRVSISTRSLGVSSSVGVTHSVQSGGTGSGSAATGPAVPLPVVVSPPAPSPQGHILGPVPLVAPSIGASIAQVGAQLPWNWFGVLAAVDLSLMAGILVRRRAKRPDSIYSVSASTDGLEPTAFDQED
jgi:hypothetical protein